MKGDDIPDSILLMLDMCLIKDRVLRRLDGDVAACNYVRMCNAAMLHMLTNGDLPSVEGILEEAEESDARFIQHIRQYMEQHGPTGERPS